MHEGILTSPGSAILVLEELSHALERGVPTIYGEVLGYGMSCDAHHLTAPSTDGSGAVNCMRAALEDAGVSTEQVRTTSTFTHSVHHAQNTSATRPPLYRDQSLKLPIVYSTTDEAPLLQDHLNAVTA